MWSMELLAVAFFATFIALLGSSTTPSTDRPSRANLSADRRDPTGVFA
jgi:hypothetical protein